MSAEDPHGSLESAATSTTKTHSQGPASATPARREAAGLGVGDWLGKYEIRELLGQGGMGVVYGAYDPDLDRPVALKLLKPGKSGRSVEVARARLLREARALAKLNHVNVITVYEVATVDGRDFVAMELVEGPDLATWLRVDAPGQKRVLEVFLDAGRGLAAAHDAGLIHRDFKPANVLMHETGRVVVTDFGLVRNVEPASESPDAGSEFDDTAAPIVSMHSDRGGEDALTRHGAVLGTPAYMAPEQFRADPVDPRTDQYSFCVALYQALYGERPFPGRKIADLRRQVLAGKVPEEPRGSSVPGFIRQALVRGLRVDPGERFASMADLLRELQREPWARRRRLAVGLAIVAAAAVVLLLATRDRPPVARSAACSPDAHKLAHVWDEDLARSIQDSFLATGTPSWQAAASGFIDAMNAYRASWSEAHRAVCAGGERAPAFHARMSCLVDGRNMMRSMVDNFLTVDATLVEYAVQAAHSLPDATRCAELDVRPPGTNLASGEPERKDIGQIRAQLAEARALESALRITAGLERAEAALAAARAIAYRPGEAEAHYTLASLHAQKSDIDQARQGWREAALIAEETDDPAMLARALVARAQLEAKFSRALEAADTIARRARVALERYRLEPRLQAQLDVADAHLARRRGDLTEAVILFERAVATNLAIGHPLGGARVLRQLVDAAAESGQFEDAVAAARRSVQLLEQQLGAEHPEFAEAANRTAVILRNAGDHDESRRYRLQAEDYWQTERGQALFEQRGYRQPAGDDTRSVSGTVLDAAGQPVAGADVLLDERLIGDGKYLIAARDLSSRGYLYQQHATTDSAGRFRFRDVAPMALVIAAESSVGRSPGAQITADAAAVNDMVLQLKPFGGVSGRVDREAGAEPIRANVMAISAGPETRRAASLIFLNPDGRFEFERLPAGDYEFRLRAEGDVLAVSQARVEPGGTAEVTFLTAPGTVALAVTIRGERGARIDGGQIHLLPGRIDVADSAGIRAHLGRDGARVRNIIDGTGGPTTGVMRTTFDQLAPGEYTLCAAPVSGNLRNPARVMELYRRRAEIDVHCRQLQVRPAPATQTYSTVVPPMRPLDEAPAAVP